MNKENADQLPEHCTVLIAGGGPCGLMLANELGRRGIDAVLVDQKETTAFNPQANATQARTMEHFRRLGFVSEVRALGLPPDFPTDIAYFTRFSTHELARFKLPSARQAVTSVASLDGSWSAAELPHRVSQKYVEQVLRRHAEALAGISVNYGWRLLDFRQHSDGVHASLQNVKDGTERKISAAFLVGADGPRSTVRQALGINYAGDEGAVRDFFGGPMLAVYVRAPDFYRVVPHSPAWMNVTFNTNRRSFMASVDGKGEFAFHTQLRPDERAETVTRERALELFREAVGAPVEAEVLSFGTWIAGYALVAEKFQTGRVFIAGDAAHLFTPAGGLGYNTAIEDAVNLGWKLAAVTRGTAPLELLDSFEQERRPSAVRNTFYAREFAESLGLYVPDPAIEEHSDKGAAARMQAGEYLGAHGKKEFNIPGVTFGTRYDGSSIIISDGTSPPPDAANSYVPSACPGGRAPHVWIAEGKSLYDLFGFEWTLLQLSPQVDCNRFIDEAGRIGMDLKVVTLDLPVLRDLYQADLALIRPDQVVAWRGRGDGDVADVLRQAIGARNSEVARYELQE